MSLTFDVRGLPPKKDGASSMWNKPSERGRLIALRSAALAAIGGRGPMTSSISLSLEIHVGPRNDRSVGDLDNFITGVCDGLQAAAGPVSGEWDAPDLASIHPARAIGFIDDVNVVAIDARKVVADEQPWYRMKVSSL